MDTYYWIGVTSAVWAINTNWEKEGGGAGYPVAGDKAYLIYADCTYDPVGGDLDMNLSVFAVGKKYNGGIASSETPLQFTADEVTIDAEDADNIYLHGGDDSSTYIATTRLLNTKADAKVYLSGAVEKVFISKGRYDFVADLEFIGSNPELVISYVSDKNRDVDLVINYGVTLPSTVTCKGGQIENYAGITTQLDFKAGQWTHGDDDVANCGDLGIVVNDGGTFIWNRGDVDKFVCNAGEVDASQGYTARTVTDVDGSDGAFLNINNGIGNITVTNPIDVQGGTFQINVSPGTEIDIDNVSDAATTTAATTT